MRVYTGGGTRPLAQLTWPTPIGCGKDLPSRRNAFKEHLPTRPFVISVRSLSPIGDRRDHLGGKNGKRPNGNAHCIASSELFEMKSPAFLVLQLEVVS
jgi:hypothetical protein